MRLLPSESRKKPLLQLHLSAAFMCRLCVSPAARYRSLGAMPGSSPAPPTSQPESLWCTGRPRSRPAGLLLPVGDWPQPARAAPPRGTWTTMEVTPTTPTPPPPASAAPPTATWVRPTASLLYCHCDYAISANMELKSALFYYIPVCHFTLIH